MFPFHDYARPDLQALATCHNGEHRTNSGFNLRGSQYVNTISTNEQMSSKMTATNYDCSQPVIVLYVEPKWNPVIDCDK